MYTAEFLDLRDGMGLVEIWPLPAMCIWNAICIWNAYGLLSVVGQELECQRLGTKQ
jgi:hypothetical protein